MESSEQLKEQADQDYQVAMCELKEIEKSVAKHEKHDAPPSNGQLLRRHRGSGF